MTTNCLPLADNVPAAWTKDHVSKIRPAAPQHVLPIIDEYDFTRISDDLDIWDAWPVQTEYGDPFPFDNGSTLWMALGSPVFANPDDRHGHARIHLLERSADGSFSHLGTAMPDGFSPGSREWSGSAVLNSNGRQLTLYFTATGHRGERELTFLQRLYCAEATLETNCVSPKFIDWRGLTEILPINPQWYMASDSGLGAAGTIKAYRDPAFFRDPQTGHQYITFAASLAGSESRYNGVVAMASREASGKWVLHPPIVTADTVNNELERPHLVFSNGLYYLFWSTQSHVFDPSCAGPTGLFGMVSDRLNGGWMPLNDNGLVFATPVQAPAQSYSWLVLPDLQVISFVDNWGQSDLSAPRRFGATFAPRVQLIVEGRRACLQH